ncbi:MAG: maleylacetoacetate isomerase [Gammaproteobacteria bacterium]|nr:maleylacetoacetate isomerase [Gammaproteobacteria bacterium]
MLKLFDYFRSTACFRVRIALNLKALSYECIPIHLLKNGGEQNSPHYAAINPQTLVPTLQDGEFTLSQSLAIIEYLEEKFPQPPLLPVDLDLKSQIRSFALAIVADTHPLNNLRVLHYLTQEFHITEEQKQVWYHHWINKTFSGLEKMLNAPTHQSKFCFGDTPTLADVCLVPQMYNARRFHCDLSSFSTLMKIDTHCQTYPAFQEAFPTDAAA